MSASRQDCNTRLMGSVINNKMVANGSNAFLTAMPTLCRKVANGAMTPLCSADRAGLTIPSERPITNPIKRGLNNPAVTNLQVQNKEQSRLTRPDLLQ